MSLHARMSWHRRLPWRGDLRCLRLWLLDRGSLTARLQCLGAFSVHLLTQKLAIPTSDECAVLGLSRGRLAWVREVVLSVDSVPAVFAHTVLPVAPRGPLTRWLARLGSRSLGSMLFAHPGFRRGHIACYALDERHELHRRAINALELSSTPHAVLWARRSCFGHGQQTILVTEIFSPLFSKMQPPSVTKTPQRQSPPTTLT